MKHEAWYTLETLNDYVVMLCDFFIYHTILHNACPLGRQCVLPPSWISTNDVWIMVNVLYVLGIKHLSCRNDRCVIVREGQFLDLKQCRNIITFDFYILFFSKFSYFFGPIENTAENILSPAVFWRTHFF